MTGQSGEAGDRAGTGTKNPVLAFRDGVAALLHSFGFLLRRPGLWPVALVPALVLLTLSLAFASAAVAWVAPAVRHAWGQPTGSWARIGAETTAWAAALAVGALGVVVALALTPPLSSPALERIVGERERELGVPARAPLGFLAEMLCGLKAQAFAASVAIPLLVLLWALDIAFPPLVVVTLPAKYVVGALALAWNLLDYPLTLRGLRMRDRLALMRRHAAACLGFGFGFVVLFSVPCFSVLMLPIGVAAAAEMYARMDRPTDV
jgi:CysZ protein